MRRLLIAGRDGLLQWVDQADGYWDQRVAGIRWPLQAANQFWLSDELRGGSRIDGHDTGIVGNERGIVDSDSP